MRYETTHMVTKPPTKKKWMLGILLACCATVPAGAQYSETAPVRYSWMPNQITASWIYTRDDYGLVTPPGLIPSGASITQQQADAVHWQRVTLSGFNLEYAYRKYYPWEILGSYRNEPGNPLGQKLATYASGVGYVRQFGRYAPFGSLQVGASHTSSTGDQYLLSSPTTGLASIFTGGVDVRLRPRWGARGYVENQYLPFGPSGSVYWSAGAGIFFRFEPQR
ncbi:MAG: hypothetical protein WCE63_21525 [Acidobacteriaceae bacterium]